MSGLSGHLELLPHYLANLVLILAIIGGLRLSVGNLGFWVELPIVVAVVLVYPTLVRALGVAPSSWER